jgi:hypothetical protein
MLARLDERERSRFMAALDGLDPGKWRFEPCQGSADDEDYFVAKTEQLRQLMVFQRKLAESRTEAGRRLSADHVAELLFCLSDSNRERFAKFPAGFKPTGDPWRDRARLLEIAFRVLLAKYEPLRRKATKVEARNQALAETMVELGLNPEKHFSDLTWEKIYQRALEKNPAVFLVSKKAMSKKNAPDPQYVGIKTLKNTFVPPQAP